MSTGVSQQVPATEGWFTWPPSDKPFLIGSQCKHCGDYFFPKIASCRNPRCMSTEVQEVQLSRTGTIYTYTINHYPAPPPYVPDNPYVPQATVSVELEKEKMIIQGMVVKCYDVNKLKIGMKVELVLEPLYKDTEGHEVIMWKFKPV